MTSKNSWFRLDLIFDALRKILWLPTLSFLAFFFSMPVATAIYLQNKLEDLSQGSYSAQEYKEILTSATNFVFGQENMFIQVLIIFGALAGAAIAFSYLHNRRRTDFFHSLPLSRTQLYLINFKAGALSIMLPYLVSVLLTLVVIAFSGCFTYLSAATFWQSLGTNLLFFAACYCLMVLSAVLSGNKIVNLLLSAFLAFVGPLFVLLYYGTMEIFYKTYYNGLVEIDKLLARSSPFFRYVLATIGTTPLTLGDVCATLAFTIAVFIFAGWLFRRRPSEAAENAIAFTLARPLLKYPVILLGSVFAGYLFYSVRNESLAWLAFGFICGLLIFSRIMEVIYTFDFKAIRKNLKSLLVFGVITGLFLLVPILDLTGYDTYTPPEGKVAKVELYLSRVNDYAEYDYNQYRLNKDNYSSWEDAQLSQMSFSDPADIAAALEITALARENTLIHKQNDGHIENLIDLSGNTTSVSVRYTLTNGRQIARAYYTVPIKQITGQLDVLLNSEEYRTKAYWPLNDGELMPKLIIKDINLFANPLRKNYFAIDKLDKDKQQNIIAAYKEDILNLTTATMKKETPVGDITFGFAETDEQYKHSSAQFPIYPSMTKTIAALLAAGLPEDAFNINISQISYLTITSENNKEVDDYYYNKPEAVTIDSTVPVEERENVRVVRDKEEIKKILALSAPEDALRYNCLREYDDLQNITVYYTDNTYSEIINRRFLAQ